MIYLCRYDLEGIRAVNFVLTSSLGGGGVSSLRIDPQVTGHSGAAFTREYCCHVNCLVVGEGLCSDVGRLSSVWDASSCRTVNTYLPQPQASCDSHMIFN